MAWYLLGALFVVSLWGVVAKHNLIKKVMSLGMANSAIVLIFVYYGSLSGDTAPIAGGAGEMVDPLPQALMLTAIVVGICVVAFALVIVYQLHRQFGTLDIRDIEHEAWKLDD